MLYHCCVIPRYQALRCLFNSSTAETFVVGFLSFGACLCCVWWLRVLTQPMLMPNMPKLVDIGAAEPPRCFQLECFHLVCIIPILRRLSQLGFYLLQHGCAVFGGSECSPRSLPNLALNSGYWCSRPSKTLPTGVLPSCLHNNSTAETFAVGFLSFAAWLC